VKIVQGGGVAEQVFAVEWIVPDEWKLVGRIRIKDENGGLRRVLAENVRPPISFK
jgi:hypothetical protein